MSLQSLCSANELYGKFGWRIASRGFRMGNGDILCAILCFNEEIQETFFLFINFKTKEFKNIKLNVQ